MTNGEKYRTAKERESHFNAMCGRHVSCADCELRGPCNCEFAWLEMEAPSAGLKPNAANGGAE